MSLQQSPYFVPRRVSPWKEEWRVELLTTLWNQGHSAGYIGKQLGVPRSAVIGKAYRLKLPRRITIVSNRRVGVRLSPEMRQRISEGMKNYWAKADRSARRKPVRRKLTKPIRRKPICEATRPLPLNIPLTETGRGRCKFIHGHDGLCCGHPVVEGKSWCEYHYGVVFA